MRCTCSVSMVPAHRAFISCIVASSTCLALFTPDNELRPSLLTFTHTTDPTTITTNMLRRRSEAPSNSQMKFLTSLYWTLLVRGVVALLAPRWLRSLLLLLELSPLPLNRTIVFLYYVSRFIASKLMNMLASVLPEEEGSSRTMRSSRLLFN